MSPDLTFVRGLAPRAWPLLLAVACLATLPSPADAQWRWRDKAGQINASDRPPPRDVLDKDILERPAPEVRRQAVAPAASAPGAGAPALAPAAAPTALEREVQARKRAAEQEQSATAKAEEARVATLRADNCRAARGQFAALESGQRMARTNDKGEREVLDDKGRAEEQRRASEVMASDCR